MRRTDYDDLDWKFNLKYPGYEFSENGDVRDSTGKIVKPIYEGSAAPKIKLRDRDGVVRKLSLARVLLETYRGERGDGFKADFRNGNRYDIRIDNLRWREVINPGPAKVRELIPGHPEIKSVDAYRNTYIRILETGREYYNIWAYIEITGEKVSITKRCFENPYGATTSKGHHIIPYLYDDGNGTVYDLEGAYD